MNQENTPTSESGAAGNDHPAAEASERSVAVDLQAEIEALQAQLQEARDDYLRAQAEVQNIRRRAEEDMAKARKFGIEGFAESLLPVIDSFEAALTIENATAAQLREGNEATLRQLLGALERNKVVPIAPAQGERFDPNVHQAISVAPVLEGIELAPNSVVNVLQKGYLIADRVLRPALVTVTSAQ